MPQLVNRPTIPQFSYDQPKGTVETRYQLQPTDIIPEIENAVIHFVAEAEQRSVRFQLHFLPAPVMVMIDYSIFQQVLSYCLSQILAAASIGAIVNLYVSDSEGKCIVEIVTRGQAPAAPVQEDYFRKYRITNPHKQVDSGAAVYKRMMEDMGAELNCANPGYVSMKLRL